DIIARMDDLLRGYLVMARERLLFHCALAKIYPELAEAAPAASSGDARFVSLADAEREIRDKLTGFARDIERTPAHDEIYRPIIDHLERRLGELAVRGQHDLAMAAQLKVLPDQMDIILNKLATTTADVSEVVADVKLVLEQTDDAVRFAEDARSSERSGPEAGPLRSMTRGRSSLVSN